jgi:maleylpyruvate isomerase
VAALSPDPIASLSALRASTAALLAGLEEERWTDDEVREPSLLPGWTRGHVLTHIARNADSINRTISGALRGEIVKRYPDGPEGRNADIEAGSGRSWAELVADVRDSAERLDRVLAAVAEADGWELPTEDRPAGGYLRARWREVEVHRVDLAGSYGAPDWPPPFVGYMLPYLLDRLEERVRRPLRIEITTEDCRDPDLAGRHYELTAQAGDTDVVTGPDWAVVAWLTGRPQAAQGRLSATPDLEPWI